MLKTVQSIARTVLWGRTMTNHNNPPKRGKVFEEHDVVHLLSAAIEREGGQTAFAKRHGLDRSGVNMILHGKKRVNDSVAAALGLAGYTSPSNTAMVYAEIANAPRRLIPKGRAISL
jgi:hypothetical protein